MLTGLILHNVESAYFFYSNPVRCFGVVTEFDYASRTIERQRNSVTSPKKRTD